MEFSNTNHDTNDDITVIPDQPGTHLQDLSSPPSITQQTFSSANTIDVSELQQVQPFGWGYHRRDMLEAMPSSGDIPQDCIESRYPKGYPRLSAFMNIEPKFDMFRRFGRLHIRILLYKQDELAELEEKLELEDSQEKNQLHLSSRRHDKNETRKHLLQEIERKLTEYDKILLRHQKFQSLKSVAPRNSRSFLNWMDGTRPLVKSETIFIKDVEDFAPSSQQLHEYGFLDSAIEWLLPKLCFGCTCIFSPKVRIPTVVATSSTKNELKFLVTPSLLVTIATIKALLIPIVLLYYLEESKTRLCIVLSFTVGISLMLAGFTTASRYEIFAATAAYCAVLVVFLEAIS